LEAHASASASLAIARRLGGRIGSASSSETRNSLQSLKRATAQRSIGNAKHMARRPLNIALKARKIRVRLQQMLTINDGVVGP
jgi:hypothetical protein